MLLKNFDFKEKKMPFQIKMDNVALNFERSYLMIWPWNTKNAIQCLIWKIALRILALIPYS